MAVFEHSAEHTDPALDAYVVQTTDCASWQDLLTQAAIAYFKRQLAL